MSETDVADGIDQVATRIAGEFMGSPVSVAKIHRLVSAALAAERERCARIAETDTDWTVFQRRPKTDWKGDQTNVYAAPGDEHMPTPANVFAYANGIAAGRAIAAAIRSGE